MASALLKRERFAEFIKQTLFPGMYSRCSTNGNGVHGYIVVQKAGVNAQRVREACKNLEHDLKGLAQAYNADISDVEIKGLPPLVHYRDNGHIEEITFGSWAKVPRSTDVMDTCKVDYHTIAVLDTADIKIEEPELPCAKTSAPKLKACCGSDDSRIVTQAILDQLPAPWLTPNG